MFRFIAAMSARFTIIFMFMVAGAALAGRSMPDSGKLLYSSGWHPEVEFYIADADSGVSFNLSRRFPIPSLPALAPDGRHLAWITYHDLLTAASEIWIADLFSATSRPVQTESPIYGIFEVSWSPDSHQLVFAAGPYIFILDTITDELHLEITDPSTAWYPTWSPDGRHIAFLSTRDTTYWRIFIADIQNDTIRSVPCPKNTCMTPHWSPDGRYLTFDADSIIYVIDMTTFRMNPLTGDRLEDASWRPLWSPDGATLLFTSHPFSTDNRDIYTYDWDSRQRHRLTDNPALDHQPVWSPDSSNIAFQSDRTGLFGIYVMDADGRDVRLLVPESSALISWQP